MSAATDQTDEEKIRVLVVEDEGIIANDIQRTLKNLGYAVAGLASSGQEAIALASNQAVDLVLMDIRIKGEIDGVATAEQIRERFQLPVIYLTAHTDDATLERAKLTEPFGYVVKPFTTTDLKVSIQIALERHRLERQIEEQEGWLSAILRSIGDAVVVSDARGRITFFNSAAEELFGVTNAAARGTTVGNLLQICYDEGKHEEEPQFRTGVLLRPDGSRRLVISSTAPINRKTHPEDHGAVIILRDISDLRKAEQALRENNWFLKRSNEHLTQLSLSLTHELKEPLRAVSCYAQLLARDPDLSLDTRGQQYLQYIKDGCVRMDSLLTSLLNYFRAASMGSASAMAVDTSRCLGEALSNLRSAIEGSGAIVEQSQLPQVYCHPAALVQLFQNLIGNAIKYRGEGTPKILVTAEEENEFRTITVVDNGVGFDPDQTEMIFGLFKRAHGRELSGSGVGLATCRRLIEQHGGRIWAESIPGHGSKFHFTLPARLA